MTKFTKERLEEIVELAKKATYKPCAMHMTNLLVVCDSEVIEEMARQLLAGMKQEPVAWQWLYRDKCHVTNDPARAKFVAEDGDVTVTPLYAAPQLPQPVVPDAISTRQAILKMEECEPCDSINVAFKYGWNACRAAMLQGAEPVIQPDELPDGWVAVPVDMAPEMMRAVQINSELGAYAAANLSGAYSLFREFWDVAIAAAPDFREISNSSTEHFLETAEMSTNTQMPSPIDHGYRPDCECSGCIATARICAELSVNSPVIPECWCLTCRPVKMTDMRFVVCPDCGNKRCPHANDHRNACTGSNEPGQEGSAYPAAPHQEEANRIHEERVKIQEEMAMGARLTKHRFNP
ncbi:hypothetical protein [Leclercia adecarboxylata]|uniref:DUF551 domain-containing protein n=1 Tax=Leclercia adecarboxylata TaxID=83655 RepID=A0A4U9I001_9ENTR|nr:hypothetical protein [Leclercia adecarboxylata]KFC98078.1 phage protein [Leclercia adecarboxylata ATCC 23216 = NBRC 102595]UBH68425.1 hypothetical protein LA332_03960 [Leclercia adecarboxylata]SPX64195.1 Uncharacterised protein [Leclercia adecarboxylata]STX23191.1 Uncharacterised protein [Leclercia adecarboxylata]VTP70428.1 Uncharacterised protein [Leclercia adecarboxylata]